MKQTLEKVFYLVLFLVTCFVQFGMSQDTSVWWQDNYTIVVSKQFKGVVPLKNPTGFKVYKGTKYVTVILEMPDTSKSYNVSLAAYPLDTTVPPPPQIVLKETVNDRDQRIKYSAGWNESGVGASWASKFNNGDVKFTYQVGASATFDFTGKKLSVIAEECDNHSNVKIEILQGTTVVKTASVNTYRSTGTAAMPASNANQCPAGVKSVIYTSDVLPQGNYTARVSLENVNLTTVPQRNSFVFDGFQVYE